MSLASGLNTTSKGLSAYLEDNNISKEISIWDLIIQSGMFYNKSYYCMFLDKKLG